MLLYKPQGITSVDYPTLPQESILVDIMTEFQVSALSQLSKRIVCLDLLLEKFMVLHRSLHCMDVQNALKHYPVMTDKHDHEEHANKKIWLKMHKAPKKAQA